MVHNNLFVKHIQKHRENNKSRGIILHDVKARSQTFTQTTQYLTDQNIQVTDHPPYSSDLAPNNLFLFPTVKNKLRGQ